MVHVERGKLLQAQTCLEKCHQLAPAEDYVLRHLQIVQNRIAKMKLPQDGLLTEEEINDEEQSKVVSNKSKETERKTEPVVSGDSEEQRYSSRVVNTEPLFVKNVNNIDYPYVDDEEEDEVLAFHEAEVTHRSNQSGSSFNKETITRRASTTTKIHTVKSKG